MTVGVLCLLLIMSWFGLHIVIVIVVIPGHSHLLSKFVLGLHIILFVLSCSGLFI